MKLACWEDPRSCFQKVENSENPLASGPKFGEKHDFGRFWWMRKMELSSLKTFSGGSDFNNQLFLKPWFVLAEEPPDAEKTHEISLKNTSTKCFWSKS